LSRRTILVLAATLLALAVERPREVIPEREPA
jgi:hypothetical protein